jgi:putative ABC transport system permease protein
VWRLIAGQMRYRFGRTAALILGIFVAATSFTVLSGSAQTARLQVTGTVQANYRAAYDILVRPKGSTTPLESGQGLVRANYLSGIFGGITTAQWQHIEKLSGVDVAAPIAMGGYLLPKVEVTVDLTRSLTSASRQLLRVNRTWVTDRGTSQAKDAPGYAYWSDHPQQSVVKTDASGAGGSSTVEQSVSGNDPVCLADYYMVNGSGPFDPAIRSGHWCWSKQSGSDGGGTVAGVPDGGVGMFMYWAFPMLVAAIDPVQEAKLDHVDKSVISGRYLAAGDKGGIVNNPYTKDMRVPVLIPDAIASDQQLKLDVQQLPTSVADGIPGHPLSSLNVMQRLASTPGASVQQLTVSSQTAYQTLIDLLVHRPQNASIETQMDAYWTPGPTNYVQQSHGVLAAKPTNTPDSTWTSVYGGVGGFQTVASTVQGQGFRQLVEHQAGGDGGSGPSLDKIVRPQLQVVGQFDPNKLPGFGALSSVPLETFNPPSAVGADKKSAAALGDKALLPDGNPAGYLQEPPSLLTTMAGLANLKSLYDGSSSAPISTIRVRVSGVVGPDPVSRERVRLVAQQIQQDTGLDVDITTGSSPAAVTVALPAGSHGRPALNLTERWVKKGVAVSILSAIDRKSIVLFGLILVVCALFVANASAASIRARRTELGVLACLGWPPSRLFATVIIEQAGIGLLAGTAGSAVALPLSAIFGLHASPSRAVLAVPAAVVLAVLAGLSPATRASRAHPAAAVRPPVLRSRRGGSPKSIGGLAMVNLFRTPGRTLLGASAMTVGVGGLTLLLAITFGFRGTLVGTLLGDAISFQTRGVDYASIAVTMLLSVLAVADLLYLNIRERSVEFATLQASGWAPHDTSRLLRREGAGIGLLGSLVGAGIGLALASTLAGSLTTATAIYALAAVLAGTALSAAAAELPARVLLRLPTARLLAEE